jgi:hypothetical protein
MKKRKPGADSLEMIMRDVLEGLQDFTGQAGLASRNNGSGDALTKEKSSALIIDFPRRFPTN